MFKIFIASFMFVISFNSVSAATFIGHDGILYGNTCRNGALFTIYPLPHVLPVGSTCVIRNNVGIIVAHGRVSNE